MIGGVAVDSDEAVIGLMGRHIPAGKYVFFFYSQEYMGSLETYLAALLFSVFESSSWVLKLAPFVFSVLFFLLSVHLTRTLYGRRVGLLTALLLVSSSPFSLVWSVKAQGGYMETLFFGTALCILVHKLLLYGDAARAASCRDRGGRLRIALNGLLFLTVLLLRLQVVNGGLQLQVGDPAISSRGLHASSDRPCPLLVGRAYPMPG